MVEQVVITNTESRGRRYATGIEIEDETEGDVRPQHFIPVTFDSEGNLIYPLDDYGNLKVIQTDATGKTQGEDGYTPQEVNMGAIQANYTEENPAGDSILTIPKTDEFLFQEETLTPVDGNIYENNGYKSMLIEITGSNVATRTVLFKGTITDDDDWVQLLGVNRATFASANQTTGITKELWEIPIEGIRYLMMDVSVLTGTNATTTIIGRMIA